MALELGSCAFWGRHVALPKNNHTPPQGFQFGVIGLIPVDVLPELFDPEWSVRLW
jgi:hypothetical protein